MAITVLGFYQTTIGKKSVVKARAFLVSLILPTIKVEVTPFKRKMSLTSTA